MITSASFRVHYPEFSDTERYPDSGFDYWNNFAFLLLSIPRLGAPGPFYEQSALLASGGTGYAVKDTWVAAGGVGRILTSFTVDSVDGDGAILTFHTLSPGAYAVPPINPVGQGSTSGAGTGATFNMQFALSPPTLYDIATELFIAHNLVLERRAQDEAAAGAAPGVTTGPVASKSADKLSVSYDVAAGIDAKDGQWNLTIYGTRFIRLVKIRGMGPLTVIGAGPPNGTFGPAWNGPIVDRGYGW